MVAMIRFQKLDDKYTFEIIIQKSFQLYTHEMNGFTMHNANKIISYHTFWNGGMVYHTLQISNQDQIHSYLNDFKQLKKPYYCNHK